VSAEGRWHHIFSKHLKQEINSEVIKVKSKVGTLLFDNIPKTSLGQ